MFSCPPAASESIDVTASPPIAERLMAAAFWIGFASVLIGVCVFVAGALDSWMLSVMGAILAFLIAVSVSTSSQAVGRERH